MTRRHFLDRVGRLGLAGLGGAAVLAGCGGEAASDAPRTVRVTPTTDGAPPVARLHPKGNRMRFQETTLVAPPATAVTLVFENTASRPSMQHNVVLLREPPTQALFQRVGEAAARAPDHVPDLPVVLAATPLSRPGETVSVTFTTPSAPGDYGYVCTYPGHWVTMQGTLRVEAAGQRKESASGRTTMSP